MTEEKSLRQKVESLTQELSVVKNENEALQKLLDDGAADYDDILAENRAICDGKEMREKDCEDALDALVALQKQFKILQSERDERIERDNENNFNSSSKTEKFKVTDSAKINSTNVTDLQNKILQIEEERTASQARTADLSKVLRTSQIRSEELLDENER